MTTTRPESDEAAKAAEKAKTERAAALNKAYTLATTDLRNAHQKEFNDLRKKHAKALGYDWEPEKSPEDRAAEQIAELLEKYPSLVDRLESLTTDVPADPDADDEPVGGQFADDPTIVTSPATTVN